MSRYYWKDLEMLLLGSGTFSYQLSTTVYTVRQEIVL